MLFVGGLGVRWAARHLGIVGAGRARRGGRVPAVAVRAAVPVTHLGDAAAVGRARLARRADRSLAARRASWRRRRAVRARRRHRRRAERDGNGDDRAGARAVAAARGVAAARSRGVAPSRLLPASVACASRCRCGGSRCWSCRAATAPMCSPTPRRWRPSRSRRRAPRRCAAWATGCSTSATRSASRRRRPRLHGVGTVRGHQLRCSPGLASPGSRSPGCRARRFAALLVFVGIVLAVGVHPIDDPSPLMSPFAESSRSSLVLALRSSTRALPMAVSASRSARVRSSPPSRAGSSRHQWLAGAAVTALAAAQPARAVDGGFVDAALARDQDPPAAWTAAAADLDALPTGFRVMQLPGAEFGAFRWGYTVDPPLPGLTERPFVTRDLLPLGSARSDGPAVRARRPLPDGHRRAGVDRAHCPTVRRRHDLGTERHPVRPLPHPPAGAHRVVVHHRRGGRARRPDHVR